FPYALDNGAWSVHAKGKGGHLDLDLFTRLVDQLGARADWCTAPDAVGGGALSLSLSLAWLPWVLDRTRLALIPVQDGMSKADLRPHLGKRVGIFVGGTTEWKLSSTPMWGELAAELGCYLHVGRVNTMGRMKICAAAGTHSIDGTSAIQFPSTIADITRWNSGFTTAGGTCVCAHIGDLNDATT
ncbi:unnamed protein product, partial [marine sediment metagenome]